MNMLIILLYILYTTSISCSANKIQNLPNSTKVEKEEGNYKNVYFYKKNETPYPFSYQSFDDNNYKWFRDSVHFHKKNKTPCSFSYQSFDDSNYEWFRDSVHFHKKNKTPCSFSYQSFDDSNYELFRDSVHFHKKNKTPCSLSYQSFDDNNYEWFRDNVEGNTNDQNTNSSSDNRSSLMQESTALKDKFRPNYVNTKLMPHIKDKICKEIISYIMNIEHGGDDDKSAILRIIKEGLNGAGFRKAFLSISPDRAASPSMINKEEVRGEDLDNFKKVLDAVFQIVHPLIKEIVDEGESST